MHGPIFTAQFNAVAITAAQDVFSILAPSTSRIAICGVYLSQYSDAGDAQAELLPILIVRGNTVAGSGGTAPTPVNTQGYTGAKASVATVRANDTAVASGGSPVTLWADAFNVQAGYVFEPRWLPDVYDLRPKLEASDRMCFRLGAPADSLTFNGTIVWEELGLVF